MTWLVLALAAGLAAAGDAPAVTVIVGATLVDGGGRPPVEDSVVVLRGPVIGVVGDRMRTPIPKGASLIDGRRMWIAPVAAEGTSAPAIAAMLRGPAARVVAGQPANIALLDADPRREAPPATVKRVWIAGKARDLRAGETR